MFIVFVFVWHVLTDTSETITARTSLTQDQLTELTGAGMSEGDALVYAGKGLDFDQINQIAGLGLTLEDLDAAGGIEAFGFTTEGGAAEEATTGFPSPRLVWQEAYEQISDPFYDKGPNDKGIGIQLKYFVWEPGFCWPWWWRFQSVS